MPATPARAPAARPLLVALFAAACLAWPAAAADLIPRKLLFGNPDRTSLQVSPDGKRVSFLAPVDGVLNVWVAPADKPDEAKAVTADKGRGIRSYGWAYTSRHVIYAQDEGGNENFNLFAVDLDAGQTKNLTANPKVQARIEGMTQRQPTAVLVGLNDRDPRFHDVHRIDLLTGEKKLVLKHPGTIDGQMVQGFVTDDDLRVRFAATALADGGTAYHVPEADPAADGTVAAWRQVDTVAMEDALATGPRGFDKTGNVVYVTDSRGRDTAALVAIDLTSGERTVLAEDPRADAGGVLVHPTEKTVQAVAFEYDRRVWKVLDKSVQPDLDYLRTVADGDVNVTGRSLDDGTWVVAYLMDDGPVRYYRYDRKAKRATFLFSNRKVLEGLPLAKMHPVVIKSRDGMNLVSYLTLPRASDKSPTATPGAAREPASDKPLPMVLLVHGGPWGRDQWGLNGMHQWLANRGYAVLSVNFRGSTGFGKAFVNAANREWAGKMHDDLIDAVNWATAKKIADPAKVGIMGGSYGGYATLVGLTFTPDVFACGVDIVGPSRIVTLLQTVPPYWAAGQAMFAKRVGDISTEEGRKFLDERSPLTRVDKIKKPLLIGQGANDPRVKQPESDQIVKAMQEKNLPVTYVLYPDEGHGFARPPNSLSFFAVTEQFLARHLGGPAEPIGEDFKGSSITVPAGKEQVPGVAEVLPATRPAGGGATVR